MNLSLEEHKQIGIALDRGEITLQELACYLKRREEGEKLNKLIESYGVCKSKLS